MPSSLASPSDGAGDPEPMDCQVRFRCHHHSRRHESSMRCPADAAEAPEKAGAPKPAEAAEASETADALPLYRRRRYAPELTKKKKPTAPFIHSVPLSLTPTDSLTVAAWHSQFAVTPRFYST